MGVSMKSPVVFDSYGGMCRAVADEIADSLGRAPDLLICIAAGHTSLGVFEELIALHRKGEADFSRAAFLAMDEWLGMNKTTEGSCGDFLRRHFLRHVNFAAENVVLPDGLAEDPALECRRMEAFIRSHSSDGRLDLVVLGAGMNGHLALNEPGTDWGLGPHVTELDAVTREVGKKYFDNPVRLTGGITLGVADFARARRAILLLSSAKKGEILGRILGAEGPDPMIPATAVHTMANADIFCDREAMEACGSGGA